MSLVSANGVSVDEASPNLSSGSLRIPESRDGFFGYLEEKSQQHVSIRAPQYDCH
jgi:AMP deaminase